MHQESGLRLFGVTIPRDGGGRRKEEVGEALVGTKSRSNKNLDTSSSTPAVESGADDHGCLTDGSFVECSGRNCGQERKRGFWTEKEHRAFLAGLKMLGKGDWKGISRNFVITKTPTQVASHAQKYFLRQNDHKKKKHGFSIFDLKINDLALAPEVSAPPLSSKGPHEVVEEVGISSNSKDRVVPPIFFSPHNISDQTFPSDQASSTSSALDFLGVPFNSSIQPHPH